MIGFFQMNFFQEKTQSEQNRMHLRNGQKAEYFSIPFLLAEKNRS